MRYPEINLNKLNSNQFEELIFDVLFAEGFENIDWIDGGADGGRDITANSFEKDASGYLEKRKWLFEVKNYKTGIPFNKIQPTLSRADASNPSYLLFAVNPHLTPQCKYELEKWIHAHSPKFSVRIWEKMDVIRKLLNHPEILRKHLPEDWSNNLEMEAYFRESIEILQSFLSRIEIIWKTPEEIPWSNIIEYVRPKDGQSNIFVEDRCHNLGKTERKFLSSLLETARQMESILCKTFNLPNTFIQLAKWDEHPEAFVVIPFSNECMQMQDFKTKIGYILNNLQKNYEKYYTNGIVAAAGAWKPYDAENRVQIFLVIPESEEKDR